MKPIALIQNWEIETPGLLTEYLDQHQLAFKVYHNYADDRLPEPSELEAAVILGCPISINSYSEHVFLKNLYSFAAAAIRRDLPLLGICYGGQLIADVLGAKVEPNKVKEIGVYQVKLTEEGVADPIFKGFDQTFDVFHWHGDTFKIPRGAQFLAEGDDCRNQAFLKGNSVAIQFHLEVNETDLPKWCDEYKEEMIELGKSKEQVLAEYSGKRDALGEGNRMFLSNWLNTW